MFQLLPKGFPHARGGEPVTVVRSFLMTKVFPTPVGVNRASEIFNHLGKTFSPRPWG